MTLEIIKRYGIKANKALGQNFLINNEILDEISNIVNIKGENIIEVGPGYGALTEKILQKKPKSLNLVELDNDMIQILYSRLEDGDLDTKGTDFIIHHSDILKYIPAPKSDISLHDTEKYSYLVIANIPYYITSPILRHFLYGVGIKPEKMLILMQKDVGEKILGKGKNKSGVLSLFVDKKCNTKEVLLVGKQNFKPAPKVESSVLLFEKHDLYNDIGDEKFLKIIKVGFTNPRKKLVKNLEILGLSKEYILNVFNQLSLDFNIRGEDLNIAKWCELIKKINI